MSVTPDEEAQLRGEIEKRIGVYAKRGLATGRMREMLEAKGPVTVLEHYTTAPPEYVRGWKKLLPNEAQSTLEWLVLNHPVARRETSAKAHEMSEWKLNSPF